MPASHPFKLTSREIQRAFLARGIRHSRKRDVILEIFLKLKGHYTIEELLQKVREIDPRIGYATVYRTLRLLKDCGFVQQRQFGDGYSRFERISEHHDHLICVKCGKIFEFEEDQIEKLQEEICQKYEFQSLSHVHEIYGYCSRCQASMKG